MAASADARATVEVMPSPEQREWIQFIGSDGKIPEQMIERFGTLHLIDRLVADDFVRRDWATLCETQQGKQSAESILTYRLTDKGTIALT